MVTTACCSHTDHTAAMFFGTVDLFWCLGIHHVELRMHMMLCHIFYFYRTKSTKTDMQSYMRNSLLLFLSTCFINSFVNEDRLSELPQNRHSLHKQSGNGFCLLIYVWYTEEAGISPSWSRISSKIPIIMKLDQTVSLIDNIYNLSGQNAVAEGDHRADLTFLPGFTRVSQISFSLLFNRRISIAASVPTFEP